MPAGRRCPASRCPVVLTRGERYCPAHAAEYEAQRGTTASRGYGARHQSARAEVQEHIDAGDIVRCVSCGARLTGTAWDLGHSDDRRRYVGPQCTDCNRSSGGRKGRASQS